MTRKLRFSCPSCSAKFSAIDGSDFATQVVRRTCPRCHETYQLIVKRLGGRDGIDIDHAEFTFIGRTALASRYEE